MNRSYLQVLLLTVATSVLATQGAIAQVPVGYLTVDQGSVYQRSNSSGWGIVRRRINLYSSDAVKLDPGSSATLTCTSNRNVVPLNGPTVVYVSGVC